VERTTAYLNDKKNGATMLSIALGHAADALCIASEAESSLQHDVRRKSARSQGRRTQAMTTEDQVGRQRSTEGGAAFSIHYRAACRAGHQPAVGDQCSGGRSAAHRPGGPGPDFRAKVTRRQRRAVLARGPAVPGVSVVTPQGPVLPPTRPSVRAFRSRLPRARISPHVRRRGHAPSDADAIETAATTGQTSNAPLMPARNRSTIRTHRARLGSMLKWRRGFLNLFTLPRCPRRHMMVTYVRGATSERERITGLRYLKSGPVIC